MTDREKAIVMAYTGTVMLTGDKLNEFYKYLAELYGRPVYTHEIITLDIQEKAKPDFVELCRTELPSAQPEIIQCKDCKHWCIHKRLNIPWCRKMHIDRGAEDFCSTPDRRTDEAYDETGNSLP